jgi:hypothetical protein
VEEEIMGKSAKGETAEEGTMNGGAEVCSVCVTLRKEGATTTIINATPRNEERGTHVHLRNDELNSIESTTRGAELTAWKLRLSSVRSNDGDTGDDSRFLHKPTARQNKAAVANAVLLGIITALGNRAVEWTVDGTLVSEDEMDLGSQMLM